jgi:hypothetical protein
MELTEEQLDGIWQARESGVTAHKADAVRNMAWPGKPDELQEVITDKINGEKRMTIPINGVVAIYTQRIGGQWVKMS